MCVAETRTLDMIELTKLIYRSLMQDVLIHEFSTERISKPTRMATAHPKEAILKADTIDSRQKAVSVNLARAGAIPSQTVFELLHTVLPWQNLRQDHIAISRVTSAQHQVQGSLATSLKIGGSIDDATVIFPDPMGATGSTLVEVLDLYKKRGKAKKYIAIHCIITPEYLRKVKEKHPDLVVYAARLDRGLSPKEILALEPGVQWDQERGLNDVQYIVPGGGGIGELLNHAEE